MTRALDLRLRGTTSADCIHTFVATGVDDETGEAGPQPLDDVTVVFVMRDANGNEKWRGTNGSGVTIDDAAAGEFTVWIPGETMDGFCPAPYRIGCTLSDGIVTVQFLLGSLTIEDGVV